MDKRSKQTLNQKSIQMVNIRKDTQLYGIRELHIKIIMKYQYTSIRIAKKNYNNKDTKQLELILC